MLLDANKYLLRANNYISQNQYGHAAGCLAKAAKKITNWQHIHEICSDASLDKILRLMIDKLSKAIEANILNAK